MLCVLTVVIVGVKIMMIRTYSELIKIKSFEDRFEYLKLGGTVGRSTFGFDRYLNQMLYASSRWRKMRDEIFIRDNGCDLGVHGHDIYTSFIIHHMNPITQEDIENDSNLLYDPELLITTILNTHNAIHYGDATLLPKLPIQRRPGDTCPWK